ncbi:MAG: bifunctional pyr operon transcriptional regulator/uracil phosphoribosyltransferase PyrR [Deltaproteobacteria bacterium]|jgi:pyrimidine operon attenuation protein/uracil phosphoribosyltransferase|nr:bifunctional pyr operon transcriptional regulator/uracil phosphoribosyltransferase PyrR [Deltaproteobacteria bacterium]MBW1856592.1 bifunctional pyr operon transcriptional regulator/uracil phosphoribosyltransferase PyrR [Deltaproteobacteria bacterium]MBW2183392.1 bifunctional pyr operon transcriptional regulator/uracil phosphoribosyltransferase PyrR [Deltaproteobacteria bacterium]
MEKKGTKLIQTQEEIDKSLKRIAHEILEKHKDGKDLFLIGIRRRGVTLAERLSAKMKEIGGFEVPIGALDINLYRDDLSEVASQPILRKTEVPFSVKDRKIILVDDVLYTGRTIRAALDAIIDLGRPHSIQLAVLLDRGHRELPIRADYVGKNVPTSHKELIEVKLVEDDGIDEVIIQEEK